MSFYMPPPIDLKIENTAKGTSLLLPYNEYRWDFQKLGIHFTSQGSASLAKATLPKNWTYTVQRNSYETILHLFDADAQLKAKVMYGLFLDVEFS